MCPDEVVWEMEPHTRAKHQILGRYLGAWFAILASAHSRVIYVDGFAGPGEYKGGEDGSPVIALNVAKHHVLRDRFRNELVFLFIETNPRRADHLQKKVREIDIPENFRVRVERASFEESITKMLDDMERRDQNLAPSFFFIDPFGPSGFPMSLIRRISQQPRSEVFVNFNYLDFNRWCLPDPSKHYMGDALYGNRGWRPAMSITVPNQKEEYLRKAYQESLEDLGWKVRPFCMINRHHQTQYYLFFATRNPSGMLAMKNAMWKPAPSGEFQYSDLSNPAQANMLEEEFEEQYAQHLAVFLHDKHRGAAVTKGELLEDLAWDPVCIERHLTRALRILEYETDPPRIVDVANRKRRGTYPEGSLITFAA